MIIHWPQFLGALVLLLPPASPFHGRQVRYRAASRHWDRHLRQIATCPWHYIDFTRAALGGWLLATAFSQAPNATGVLRYGHVLIPAVVVLASIMLQTFVTREEDAANATYPFAAGLVLGFLPLPIGAFAVLLAGTIATGARKPGAFLPVLALSVVAIGLVLGHVSKFALLTMLAGLLAPWVAVFMFQRTVVVAYVSRHGVGSTPPIAEKQA